MHIIIDMTKIDPKNNKKFLTISFSLMLNLLLILELKNDKNFSKNIIPPKNIKILYQLDMLINLKSNVSQHASSKLKSSNMIFKL